jgi:hypothetical protein
MRNTHTYADSNGHSDTYPDSDADSNTHANTNSYSHCHCYRYSNGHSDCASALANPDGHAQNDANAQATAAPSPARWALIGILKAGTREKPREFPALSWIGFSRGAPRRPKVAPKRWLFNTSQPNAIPFEA